MARYTGFQLESCKVANVYATSSHSLEERLLVLHEGCGLSHICKYEVSFFFSLFPFSSLFLCHGRGMLPPRKARFDFRLINVIYVTITCRCLLVESWITFRHSRPGSHWSRRRLPKSMTYLVCFFRKANFLGKRDRQEHWNKLQSEVSSYTSCLFSPFYGNAISWNVQRKMLTARYDSTTRMD